MRVQRSVIAVLRGVEIGGVVVMLCFLEVGEETVVRPAWVIDDFGPSVVVVFVASYPTNYSSLTF
jgi:hypothetical protein